MLWCLVARDFFDKAGEAAVDFIESDGERDGDVTRYLDVVGDFLRGDVGDVPLCEAQVSTSPNFFARSS